MNTPAPPPPNTLQTAIGVGVLLLALGLALGAVTIPSEAGYGGVGPNFLPWVVSLGLAVCGGFIVREARTGGFRELDEPSDASRPYWAGFVWMSAGLLANAALVTTIGFILGCTLCFVLAVHGLRNAEGKPNRGLATWLKNCLIGLAISAPVYWMFTQFLGINLPGLTATGWL